MLEFLVLSSPVVLIVSISGNTATNWRREKGKKRGELSPELDDSPDSARPSSCGLTEGRVRRPLHHRTSIRKERKSSQLGSACLFMQQQQVGGPRLTV